MLARIGERFANSVKTAVIRGNQTIPVGETVRSIEADGACGSR